MEDRRLDRRHEQIIRHSGVLQPLSVGLQSVKDGEGMSSLVQTAAREIAIDTIFIVTVPIEHYDPFLDNCEMKSRAYRILKNGIVVHKDGQRAVEIACDRDTADELLNAARRVYPELVQCIEACIRLKQAL
jgi:hypothetical protein